MKRLRISKLMDEYTDAEFFPTGGSAVSTEAVKARVLANAKTPAKKKQMSRKKKVLLAATLAAAMVLLMAAGYPLFQRQLVNGTLSFEQTADSRTISIEHDSYIVKNEDGRLIFTQGDSQCIDITDLVSEETPYIYDGSDPDSEMVYYVVMGGTPEAYGWLEWIRVPYPFDDSNSDFYHASDFDENGNPVSIAYDFHFIDLEDGYQSGGMGSGGVCLDDITPPSWLLAGIEELGIPVRETPEYE